MALAGQHAKQSQQFQQLLPVCDGCPAAQVAQEQPSCHWCWQGAIFRVSVWELRTKVGDDLVSGYAAWQHQQVLKQPEVCQLHLQGKRQGVISERAVI
jgi:hypothetical protein